MHDRDNILLNKPLKQEDFKFAKLGLATKIWFRSSDSFGLYRMKLGTSVDTFMIKSNILYT